MVKSYNIINIRKHKFSYISKLFIDFTPLKTIMLDNPYHDYSKSRYKKANDKLSNVKHLSISWSKDLFEYIGAFCNLDLLCLKNHLNIQDIVMEYKRLFMEKILFHTQNNQQPLHIHHTINYINLKPISFVILTKYKNETLNKNNLPYKIEIINPKNNKKRKCAKRHKKLGLAY